MISIAVSIALGAEISGVVEDELGEPIPGASVYVLDNRLGYAADYTDENGEFTISGVPEREYRIWVVPASDSNYPSRFAPDGWSYCDGDIVSLGDSAVEGWSVSLPIAGVVTGRIVDSDGEGRGGVTVELRGIQDRATGVRRSSVSDDEGEFSVNGLDSEAGQVSGYEVRFSAPELPTQELGGVYDDGETVLSGLGNEGDIGEVELLSGIVVEGTVRGPEGALPDAAVYVYSGSQVTTVYTDVAGEYSANALPPGDVLPWASLEGYGLTYYPDNDRPVEWVVSEGEGTTLNGVDIDMPNAANAKVELLNDGIDMSGVSALAYNDDFTVGIGAASDVSGTIDFNRLHAGEWAFFIYAADEGYVNDFVRDDQGDIQSFTVSDTGVEEVVVLPRGASMSGTITDETGEAVYGASVYLTPQDDRLHSVTTKSDFEGRYEIQGMVPGLYKMEVRYSVYCGTDPGYVRTYWPGEVSDSRSQVFELADGDEVTDVEMVLPLDSDHDGMSDTWEEAFGLSVGLDDSDMDYDGDGFTNLEEYLLGTDPNSSSDDSTACGGCSIISGGDSPTRSGEAIFLLLGVVFGVRRKT